MSDKSFGPNEIESTEISWKTKYCDPDARKKILYEAIYVSALLLLCPVLLFITQYISQIYVQQKIDIYDNVIRYSYAWVGGLLGGTLFDVKWLYHSVAHGLWISDRWLWRVLSPHLSSGLAFIFIVLVDSKLIVFFDPEPLSKPPAVVSIAFLVGYFSDSALAKLADVAQTLFSVRAK